MIRVVLRGRTGNNFFQYAVGRHLSLKHGVPLLLDGSWMIDVHYRQAMELLRLPIKARMMRGLALPARGVRKLLDRHWAEWKFDSVHREPHDDHGFDERALACGPNSLLIGYYQSWRYFQEIRETLLAEINLDSLPWDPVSTRLRDELESSESVAVHVRRTDYLDHHLTRVCGQDYQVRAIDLLRRELRDPIFHFFSDDLDWCRATFAADDCRFVDVPAAADDPFTDMRLMSHAKHNIIVNSSYSWWAAWLNRNPGQRVIAPDKWGNGGALAPIEEKVLPHWTIIAGSESSP
jgi:hypothetical protein